MTGLISYLSYDSSGRPVEDYPIPYATCGDTIEEMHEASGMLAHMLAVEYGNEHEIPVVMAWEKSYEERALDNGVYVKLDVDNYIVEVEHVTVEPAGYFLPGRVSHRTIAKYFVRKVERAITKTEAQTYKKEVNRRDVEEKRRRREELEQRLKESTEKHVKVQARAEKAPAGDEK